MSSNSISWPSGRQGRFWVEILMLSPKFICIKARTSLLHAVGEYFLDFLSFFFVSSNKVLVSYQEHILHCTSLGPSQGAGPSQRGPIGWSCRDQIPMPGLPKSIFPSSRVDSNEFYVHSKVARHSRRVQVQAEVPVLEAELCVEAGRGSVHGAELQDQ